MLYGARTFLPPRDKHETGGRPTLWHGSHKPIFHNAQSQLLSFYMDVNNIDIDVFCIYIEAMITAGQIRAARALLDIDQRSLAELAGLSLPTIQRMEASEGNVRGNIDSLTKLVEALEREGIMLIGEGASSDGGGRGVRLREGSAPQGRAG